MRRPLVSAFARLLPPLLATALLAAGGGLAGGCRPGEGDAGAAAGASTPAAAERPVRGGTAVIGWSADIAGVNELVVPSTNITDEVAYQLFLHLVQEQADFEKHPPTFEPQLAERWEFSPDHKTLTFHLRPGVVWSDGVPVTAEDVRWTWQAQTSPEVGYVEGEASKGRISDVEVVDPQTVRFHFREVYGKQLLDANEGGILPKHAWEKLPFSQWRQSADWFREHLVTDGPFLLAAWKPQQEVVLARNPRYWRRGFPYLDKVVIRVVPDQSVMLTQLQNGELDYISGISPADVPAVLADPDLQLVSYPFKLFVTVAWNTQDPRFASPEVRRALAMAIDRRGLVDALWGKYARLGASPIVANVWARDPQLQPLPYDPQAARGILAAHGWRDRNGDGLLDKDGKPFAFELTTNAGNQQRADAAVMIQEQLRRIGVKVEPRVLEFHTLSEQLDNGTFAATIMGFGMDSSLDMTSLFHSRSIKEGNNFARYRNPEMDRLLGRIVRWPDIVQARDDLYRLQEIAARDQPLTYLWESQRLNAASKRLRGIESNILFALFDLEEWWIRPPSAPR